MSGQSVSLASRWWWRKSNPAADVNGVAFGYEILARVSWRYAAAADADPGGPVYPMGKPFVELSSGERAEAEHLLEGEGGVLPPKPPPLWTVPVGDPDGPPAGWIRFAFEFDPARASAGEVAALVEEHVKAEAARLGVALPKGKGGHGRRNNPYPWKTLGLADRMLAGEKLESYDRQNALLLLGRYENLWPLWYLSPGDPAVWRRDDARGFLRSNAARNVKQ